MRYLAALACTLLLAGTGEAQNRPDPQALISAQKEAMKSLSFMDGVWRGSAWTVTEKGRHAITHTERVGSFLDGSVKVIEGRGYEPDGKVSFNALGIISYDPATTAYRLQSYALGRAGSFALTPTDHGYVWEVPAGPGAVIRYTAAVRGNEWLETGERVAAGGQPLKIFEMRLKRVGDTSWPAADPVPPK